MFIIDNFNEHDFNRSKEWSGDVTDMFITYEAFKSFQERCINAMDSIQLSFFENIMNLIKEGKIFHIDKEVMKSFDCSGFYFAENGIRFFATPGGRDNELIMDFKDKAPF